MIRLKSKFIVRVYNNFKFPCGKYYAQNTQSYEDGEDREGSKCGSY